MAEAQSGKKSFTIHIDRATFKTPFEKLTGAQIRGLPTPPVGPDRDLYLQQKGKNEDRLIRDDDVVDIEEGLHFYTAPTTINPG